MFLETKGHCDSFLRARPSFYCSRLGTIHVSGSFQARPNRRGRHRPHSSEIETVTGCGREGRPKAISRTLITDLGSSPSGAVLVNLRSASDWMRRCSSSPSLAPRVHSFLPSSHRRLSRLPLRSREFSRPPFSQLTTVFLPLPWMNIKAFQLIFFSPT